jgi:hypothetical protein
MAGPPSFLAEAELFARDDEYLIHYQKNDLSALKRLHGLYFSSNDLSISSRLFHNLGGKDISRI